jgi:uncharacterized heparinase superfamily protein
LNIEDHIDGKFGVAVAYFHLHPQIEALTAGPLEVELSWPNGSARMSFAGATALEVRAGTWHPEFGLAVANRCIVARLSAGVLCTMISWSSPS